MRSAAFAWLMTLAFGAAAMAADLPGSKDPPGLKRYEGSQIIHHVDRSFSEYRLDRDGGWGKIEKLEGAIGRVVYLVPEGHTALELLRNYEDMLSSAGFQQSFELKSEAVSVINSYFCERFFFATVETYPVSGNAPYRYCGSAQHLNYATYKASRGGQDLNIAVLAGESGGLDWAEPQFKASFPVKPGQVVVAVDVVTAKAVENKMVFVKAADMADALATKGKVDLYGIYFDIDKTDIKPESAKTLEEVASLLKIDRSLRLEIAGHTDSTGAADHNRKLSEGRAQAVVDALAKTYGIDAARLQAKGYGDTKPVAPNDSEDGRAKNRRVELRKL